VNNRVQNSTEFIGGKGASIIDDRCTSCGICLEYCRFDAIKHETHSANGNEERYWIDKHTCDGCAVCVRNCPEQAIAFKEVVQIALIWVVLDRFKAIGGWTVWEVGFLYSLGNTLKLAS